MEESEPGSSVGPVPSVPTPDFSSHAGMFTVQTTRGDPGSSIILEPVVNGVILPMELDTGASVSLISELVWKEMFPNVKPQSCDTLLNTYTGEPLQVLGQLRAQVRFNNQEKSLPLVVVKGDGPSLWGRS